VDIEELYDAHAPRLYALALRIAGDRDAAAAALQDVFLRVWEGGDASFPLLVRLTRERALARRQGQSAPSDVGTVEATPASLVEALFFDGVSLRDLAGRHGMGESQVRRMVRDGMAALRSRVAQQE
jgi:DNA-directed RNA polymerase specialized sigma24 family protein